MRADYVRTARAKGMSERTIIVRHILKNALLPLITVLGPQIPNIATGSIFIESVFRISGLGRYFVSSTANRDYPMIMATMLIVALLWGFTYLAERRPLHRRGPARAPVGARPPVEQLP